MANQRRLADGIEPCETIDLTEDMEEPVGSAATYVGDPRWACPICILELVDPVATMCGHIFCKGCLERSLVRAHVCPLCKREVRNTLRLYV